MSVASRFQPTPVFREKRRARLASVRIADASGRELEALVRDVSARGLSAAARAAPPRENEVVMLTLPGGASYRGLVRWVDGNLFGVEFDMVDDRRCCSAAAR